ncbi:MAG: hypothetical protein R3B45_16325 [Bdellovibrionota bacterium]
MSKSFSQEDQIIARSLMKKLPLKHRKALALRFWHNQSIFEISKIIRASWEDTDRIIKEALRILKSECLNQPHFSRTLYEVSAA